MNKTDNSKLLEEAVEFYNLGIGEYFPISSISGSGTGELLDELILNFNEESATEELDIPKLLLLADLTLENHLS